MMGWCQMRRRAVYVLVSSRENDPLTGDIICLIDCLIAEVCQHEESVWLVSSHLQRAARRTEGHAERSTALHV